MFNEDRPSSSLPDVASLPHASGSGVLDWVGMDGMEMPVQFDAGDGQVRQTSARVGAFVNLAKEGARGIHMSRLYLLVDEALSAGPVDEAVAEPTDAGVGGMSVLPSSNRTRSTAKPNASAAIWVITVYVPQPIS